MKADFKSFNFFYHFLIFDHGEGVKLDFNGCVFLVVRPSVLGGQRLAGKRLILCIQTYVLFVLVYDLMGAEKTA